MSLYDLPKDILIQLISNIQEQTIKCYQNDINKLQAKIKKLNFKLAYHNPLADRYGKEFKTYSCNREGCDEFIYGPNIDHEDDIYNLNSGQHPSYLFSRSPSIGNDEIYNDIYDFDISCQNNEIVSYDDMITKIGAFCFCCKIWVCHNHISDLVTEYVVEYDVLKLACKRCYDKISNKCLLK